MQVGVETFCELLDALRAEVQALQPRPRTVVGVKRSGLIPGVYLSEQLGLPFLVNTELKTVRRVPGTPVVIVDTTCWTGRSIRRTVARLARFGVEADEVWAVVLYGRTTLEPPCRNYIALRGCETIPVYWFQSGYGRPRTGE